MILRASAGLRLPRKPQFPGHRFRAPAKRAAAGAQDPRTFSRSARQLATVSEQAFELFWFNGVTPAGMTSTAATQTPEAATADRALAAFMEHVARVNTDPYFLGR